MVVIKEIVHSNKDVCTVLVHCCTWPIPETMVNATGSDICEDKQQDIDSV